MGNSLKVLFTILFLFRGAASFARPLENRFEINEASFSLRFNDSWRATEGLFGLPLVLSGPVKNHSRPIISVTPTPFEKTEFDHKKLKDDQVDYESERKDWLSKKGGQVIAFDQMKRVKFNEASGYRAGFSYRIQGQNFSEASYYIVCDKRLYHLKYLLKGEQSKIEKEVQGIIRSFECF